MEKKYLFGAVYIIEPDYSDGDIARDLENMKKAGFNLITLWPVANPWLSKSSTQFLFDRTIKVMDLCDQMGIKCILQLFGQNPAQEFMSDSLLTYDMMIHDEEGEHVNYNEFWMNLNHPDVRDLLAGYFEVAIKALKGHPALYGWDVFNEAHFRSDDKYTVRLYQKWLEKKYKDIHVLNRQWYRRYESFAQVTPLKRRSTYSVWSSLLPSIEYERFRSENLTDICRFLYDTAKAFDDKHPIIIDGTSGQILFDSVIGRNNDEFDTAMVPDVYGGTFYPKSWGRNYKERPWMAGMYFLVPSSAARKAGKPYFVNELQTHTQSALTPGSEVTTEELVNWTWMCIFTGADGMQLWRWRPFLHGYQSTGRGITQMDGTPNDRCRGMAGLTQVLHENSEIFGSFKTAKPVVRIGLSYRSRLVFDAFTKWQKNNWPEAVAGWYRSFWNMGVQIDFMNLDNLDETEMSTPVIVLPSIVSLSVKAAEWLESYVKKGGLLIADARLNAVNEWGVVPTEGIPGSVLTKVFGVKEADVNIHQNFVLDGESINSNFMYQELELGPDAKAVAHMEDGKPAVVVNKYGKGGTVYFNSFIGVEMNKAVPTAVKELLKDQLLGKYPGTRYVEKSERVHISYLDSAAGEVMQAVNFSDKAEEIKVCNLKAKSAVRNMMTDELTEAGTEIKLDVPANATRVFVWQSDEV